MERQGGLAPVSPCLGAGGCLPLRSPFPRHGRQPLRAPLGDWHGWRAPASATCLLRLLRLQLLCVP
eukprot:13111035-Alexandrium_andersonii.AAC.1